jgi:peptidoglycan/LPS O-acetylase OafA/YrhL
MKIIYRPEIDGLRAIAVISVIIYHSKIKFFNIDFFSGGFLGVDIFFVISGYLITTLILNEILVYKNFSFTNFFERRIRRIVPLLFFVIFFTLFLGYLFLIPNSFDDLSSSILFSIFFLSNLYFWNTGIKYDSLNSLYEPFLHTWSLSIEVQFYIIFAFFLFFIFKILKKNFFIILILLTITSALFSFFLSKFNPILNFYFLPSRLFELLAGSIIAYVELFYFKKLKTFKINNKYISFIFPFLGLIIICASIFFFNDKLSLPSFFTLIPILGVSLVIFFSDKDEIITRILSSKPFVYIGLISYSLYLWHYPLFAFARITNFTQGDVIRKIYLITFLFFLSIITYFFIECLFRNRKIIKKKLLKIILFFSFIFITILCSYIIVNKGFQNNLPEILKNTIIFENLKNADNEICFNKKNKFCKFDNNAEKKLFLLGDSQLDYISVDLKKKLEHEKYSLISMTNASCFYILNFDLLDKNRNKISDHCNSDIQAERRKEILKYKESIIVIGGRLPVYLSGTYFNNNEGGVESKIWNGLFFSKDNEKKSIEKGIIDSINELLIDNKIILIYPIPETGWNVSQKIFFHYRVKNLDNKKFNNYLLKNPITTSYSVYLKRSQKSFELLDSINHKNVYRIYPNKFFCDKLLADRCITHDDKNIYYYDDNHLSYEGSKIINEMIIKKIHEINNSF